jgi:hypothetical protein
MECEKSMDNDVRLWGRLIDSRGRMIASETAPVIDGDVESAFLELCHRFDIERPIQLHKHNREFEEFNTTFFTREHFTEPISFKKFEIELIADHKPTQGHSRRPIEDA